MESYVVQFRIALTLPLLRSHRKGLFTLPVWILAFSIPLVVLLSMIWRTYVIEDVLRV